MQANNAPLRGFKQEDYEGGIHVPFMVSWPGRLKAGTTCSVPIMSFDILPTALAAAGIPTPKGRLFDGKNMLPALLGETDELHDHLCWNSGDGKWAIRRGRWKLVGVQDRVELFDLAEDLSETTDLSKTHPERVEELKKVYEAWLDEMAEPLKGGFKRWDPSQAAKPNKKLKNNKDRSRTRRPGGSSTP